MADAQLLTKQVIAEGMSAVGSTVNVRFNLSRGKVARIWGFSFGVYGVELASREFSCFVRKTPNSPRQDTPKDMLWQFQDTTQFVGAAGGANRRGRDTFFPKPHRTTGVTVQIHATATISARAILIIYYDIDDMIKGEATQSMEKSITKGRTRRTF